MSDNKLKGKQIEEKKKEGYFDWTAKVGSKGQIVIPKEARDVFNIKPGDTVLLMGDVRQGIGIISGEAVGTMISKIMGDKNEKQDE